MQLQGEIVDTVLSLAYPVLGRSRDREVLNPLSIIVISNRGMTIDLIFRVYCLGRGRE